MAAEFIPIAIAQLWQVTLLILVVAALSRWLSPKRPHLSHLLWLVVLIKCVTPPLWASPGGVFCWLQPKQQIDTPFVEHVEWTPVAWDELLDVENTSTMDFETGNAPFAGVYLDESADAELTAASSVVEPPVDQPLGNRIGNVALVAWAVISGFVLLGVTIRWLRFWSLVRASPRRDSPELDAMLRTLSKQLGVRRRVRLIVTESLVGPAVVGFFRVTVLIPAVVADKLKGESVAPILAHELLHIRRGDLWVGLLQTVAQALWWFHPLVWWVGRATSREAERCCDEEVLGELNCDPASYARALLDVLDLKSQLKPVPVFPGVRPVDVTSQRLERIMTLRQGCRRRSPWWCWLVAIGAAVLTLPGAAFVVTAQEESPKPTANEEFSALPAPPAKFGLGTASPMAFPQDTELAACAFGIGNDTPITEVYDIAEFMPLLSGNESEKQQKFERLVRSRDAARDAQINWFNNQPVVKTTPVGHADVRQCIDLFVGSDATSETVDAYVDSVTKQSQSKLAIDLQLITLGESAYGNVEDAVVDAVGARKASAPWVVPVEIWEAILESEKRRSIGKNVHDGVSGIDHTRLALFNGQNAMVNSCREHPVSFKREDDGSLIPGKNWSGWKTQLLPFVRNDGKFWLGVSVENGKIVGRKSLTPQQVKQTGFEGATTIHEYQHVKFSTTLKEGQLVVLPGFTIAYDHETPRATLMTARVRRHSETSSPKAVASLRQLSGTGVNSDAGINGSVVLDAQVASDQKSKATTAPGEERAGKQKDNRVSGAPNDATKPLAFGNADDVDGRLIFQHGPFRVNVVPGTDAGLRMTIDEAHVRTFHARVSIHLCDPKRMEPIKGGGQRLDLRGDRCRIRPENDVLIFELNGNASFNTSHSKAHTMAGSVGGKADSIEIAIPKPQPTGTAGFVRCQMKNATVAFKATNDADSSLIRAEEIVVTLNPESFDIASVNASRIESLRGTTQNPQRPLNRGLESAFSEEQQILAERDTIRRRQALQQLVSPNFKDEKLTDVVAWVRESCGVNILIDRSAIEEEGVTLSTPVSIELKDVELHSALSLLLRPLNLGLMLDDESGVLIVTSKLQMQGRMVAAAYPVADLVIPIPRSVVVKSWDDGPYQVLPASALASGVKREIVGAIDKRSSLDMTALAELIQSVVEPDSWQEVGGVATLRTNETTLSLVIRQTKEVHREISDLLDQLRRLQDITIEVKTELIQASDELVTGFRFQALSKTNQQRFAVVSQEEAAVLRRGSTIQLLPKISLFNTQTCELYVEKSGEDETKLMLQPVASADHSVIRMAVGYTGMRAPRATDSPLTSLPALPSGTLVLLELSNFSDTAVPIVGEPIPGRPRAFRQVSQPRRFVLIQPKVVIVEEEEELLGIDSEQ